MTPGVSCPRRSATGHDGRVRDVTIRGDVIRLGQLLKLSGLADSGGEARMMLEQGDVRVNGELEHRRGRQLHDGDVVEAADERVRVVAS